MAIVDNAAMNVSVYKKKKSLGGPVLNSLVEYPEMEWLNHMVILFKNFCRIAILVSMVAAPFCIPTNSTQWFQFLYILINPGQFLFLWRSHLNCAEVYHIVVPLVFETEFLENCSAFQPLHLRGQKSSQ